MMHANARKILRLLAPALLLAAAGVFVFHSAFRPAALNSASARTRADIENLKVALGLFELNAGRYPTGEEGLRALASKPGQGAANIWERQYLEYLPRDAWGREFRYACPPAGEADKGRYEIVSAGADGRFGTRDDIAGRGQRFGAAQRRAGSDLGVEWFYGAIVIAAGALALHGLRLSAQAESTRRERPAQRGGELEQIRGMRSHV